MILKDPLLADFINRNVFRQVNILEEKNRAFQHIIHKNRVQMRRECLVFQVNFSIFLKIVEVSNSLWSITFRLPLF